MQIIFTKEEYDALCNRVLPEAMRKELEAAFQRFGEKIGIAAAEMVREGRWHPQQIEQLGESFESIGNAEREFQVSLKSALQLLRPA